MSSLRNSQFINKPKKVNLKLIEIKKSPLASKKWRAMFSDGTKTDFGASGYLDYTMHKNKKRKLLYQKRHLKDLKTKDPKRAGYLSYYILWNKESLNASINDYKKRLYLWNKTGKWSI